VPIAGTAFRFGPKPGVQQLKDLYRRTDTAHPILRVSAAFVTRSPVNLSFCKSDRLLSCRCAYRQRYRSTQERFGAILIALLSRAAACRAEWVGMRFVRSQHESETILRLFFDCAERFPANQVLFCTVQRAPERLDTSRLRTLFPCRISAYSLWQESCLCRREMRGAETVRRECASRSRCAMLQKRQRAQTNRTADARRLADELKSTHSGLVR